MTSTSQQQNTTNSTSNNPYAYQRPSTIATRAMADPNHPQSPTEPSDPTQTKPVLRRQSTHHYEEALASQLQRRASEEPVEEANGTMTSTLTTGLAYRGDDHVSKDSDPRPGMLGRQQSWKEDDRKRMNMEQMLTKQMAGGYTSSHHGSYSSAGNSTQNLNAP